ncbi:SDR family oxidoreductase [Neoroseomonas oryzicola]|uniref:SDR family oxidoreductase n=1 Tax=Neoroseomonas oryzicola TaxID=535904 RepID=A0A9X9WMH2_9PROT|nr:SDR family oxidoreductase [Neoroseomonas oryzicola]MBR0661532.1 SDR family oxidoreductase [Neoroseomonas oryzicola]NKE18410.1 SDR family oxidoreductase [Neoroseomonas oryzicola]
MDLGFSGRRVLVVGASAGIGFATAEALAAEGAGVVMASRDAAGIAAAADRIAAATGRRPATAVADITQDGAAEALLAEVAARWGAVDAVVDAVGGSIRSGFEALSDADWIGNYTFNVLSAVRVVRAALPLLRKGHAPSVVLLGAAASRMPYPNQIVSNVHKAGLLGLTKTLAGEYAAEGIRVNCVAPGRTLTRLWTDRAAKLAAERNVTAEDVIAEFAHEIPLGRFGNPEEIAAMVVWLSSPRASYVTGQTVNVDGGIARGLL